MKVDQVSSYDDTDNDGLIVHVKYTGVTLAEAMDFLSHIEDDPKATTEDKPKRTRRTRAQMKEAEAEEAGETEDEAEDENGEGETEAEEDDKPKQRRSRRKAKDDSEGDEDEAPKRSRRRGKAKDADEDGDDDADEDEKPKSRRRGKADKTADKGIPDKDLMKAATAAGDVLGSAGVIEILEEHGVDTENLADLPQKKRQAFLDQLTLECEEVED